MTGPLSVNDKQDFIRRGFSRRHFGRLAALITTGATLPFYNEAALAQLSAVAGGIPADGIRLNANENPLGPCPEAAEAMHAMIKQGGRYFFEETRNFERVMAESEDLKPDYVRAFPGSSIPLHNAVMAFTSPQRSFVCADPGYEAGENAARFIGAKVNRVALTKEHAHDVKAMVKADPNAGVFYICNPNNPTGTLTSRSDIDWLMANKPAGSIVLLDEAYYHIAGITPGTDLVRGDKDVIILRTFSKIYGMAGLRAGAALGRPDLLEKIRRYTAGYLPSTGMVGATASLKSKTLVPERRKLITEIRDETCSFLEKNKFTVVPSMSNKFMMDVKRPAGEVVRALAQQKIYVGRVWQAWPNHIRVTVGTRDEMAKFQSALLKVTA